MRACDAANVKSENKVLTALLPFAVRPGDFYQYLWRFRMPGDWPDETGKKLNYAINVGKGIPFIACSL